MAGESLSRQLVVRALNLLLILGPETDGRAWRVSCSFSAPAEKCLGGVSSCVSADSFRILLNFSSIYQFLFSPERATCLTHLILLDFITAMLFGEHYQLYCSSLCSFRHSPVTFNHSDQNIFSAPYSRRPSACVLRSLRVDQVSHPYLIRQHYSSVYFNLYIFRLPTGIKFFFFFPK